MYQSYYGLQEMPFHITPDPKFLYLSETHQEALQHLKYGVSEKKGFIVLIGEVGCGKTTLCRRFLSELDPQHYDTALVLNPRLTETQMLKAILAELGETRLDGAKASAPSEESQQDTEKIRQQIDLPRQPHHRDEAHNKFRIDQKNRATINTTAAPCSRTSPRWRLVSIPEPVKLGGPALTGSRLVLYFQGLEPSSIETVPLHGSGETGSDADLRRPTEQPLRLGNIGPGIVHVRRVQRGDLHRGFFPQRGFDQGDDLLERK